MSTYEINIELPDADVSSLDICELSMLLSRRGITIKCPPEMSERAMFARLESERQERIDLVREKLAEHNVSHDKYNADPAIVRRHRLWKEALDREYTDARRSRVRREDADELSCEAERQYIVKALRKRGITVISGSEFWDVHYEVHGVNA